MLHTYFNQLKLTPYILLVEQTIPTILNLSTALTSLQPFFFTFLPNYQNDAK